MPNSGLRHIDVGPELSRTEWESQDTHELIHGNAFPDSPAERQLFYRDDEHKWYIYNGSQWAWLDAGMQTHDNTFHSPPFEQQGVAASLVADHAAILDAHTKNFLELFRTGEYTYLAPFAGVGTLALWPNDIFAGPIFVARTLTLDRLAIQITTAAAAGTRARLGIYNNGTNVYPGSLLLDAGEVAIDTTGVVFISINQQLTRGLYWVAFFCNGSPTIRCLFIYVSILGFTAFDGPHCSWRLNRSYGALPNPFPSGAVRDWARTFVWQRIASLD